MKEAIIFSDLDGTLLDHDTYSFKDAKEALKLIKKHDIPLIFCTSKNRAEIEYYRKKLKNKHPFISENGSAVYIPKGYFGFQFDYDTDDDKYLIIKLGTDYNYLIKKLREIKKKYKILGFHEMPAKELSIDTGLTLKQAKLAKKREFDEAFKIIDKKDEKNIIKEIKKRKLNHTKGGRYHHIMGNNDKGKAVKILTNIYKKNKDVLTVGLGDSKNDFEMLDIVDKAIIVQKKDESYASNKYDKAKGIGPKGWNNAIKEAIIDNAK
ncbi:HAD-IIB family hydrolase [Candidatus Woesearchaeota archaeon]|nr:HAD-IIB family hydrolase [Candidatus Woesearchaeota archaeon]